MNKIQTNTLLVLLTLSICIGGCNRNDTEQPPVTPVDTVIPSDTVIPVDTSNISFGSMTIEQVQEILQGKWKIISIYRSGFVSDQLYEPEGNEYVEFRGIDTIRFCVDSTVYSYEIIEWKDASGGYKVFSTNYYYITNFDGWYNKQRTYYSFNGINDKILKMWGVPSSSEDMTTFTLIREE